MNIFLIMVMHNHQSDASKHAIDCATELLLERSLAPESSPHIRVSRELSNVHEQHH